MKNTIKTLALALLFIACSSANTQAAKAKDGTFESQLGKILTAMNNVDSVEGLFENINKLKRLSNMYPDEWLADYYIALMDIKIAIGSDDESKQEGLLKEAKNLVSKLKEKDNSSASEVLTLEGYYYYARIVQNPSANGQLYYMDVIQSYQKAIALDDSNPRPLIMLTIFKKMMAQSTGQETPDICKDFLKAENKLKNAKPVSRVSPSWGVAELKRHQQESCS